MKNFYLLTVLLIVTTFSFAQSEINPIKQGQYFEQGYGMPNYTFANEECATDLQKTTGGLVFTGYTGNETDGYNMAFWQLDEIGALVQFGMYGDIYRDQIGSAIMPDPIGGFCLVGRETDLYTYNHQSMHSTIADGDKLVIKYISTLGVELSSTTLGHADTPQVAVDVINDGSGNFIVLANRRYSEFDIQDMRVIKISPSGTIIWDKIHAISNTDLFGQKIIANGSSYLILTNDIDNQEPILYKISSTGVYENHYNYAQSNPTMAYGIAANSSGYHLAGESDNGTDHDGIIINVNTSFVETSTLVETNPTSGNEGFRDIVAHPNGYLATGSCDNLGEGMNDVWLVHYDNSFNAELVETLGGEEDDYGYSAVLVPEVFSVFVGGFNSSYGIQESGNAYLGGVKVDMGLPESEECVIPRVLWVDGVVGRPVDFVVSELLGNTSKENDLIQFAVDNKIKYLALFDLGLIFDDHGVKFPYIQPSQDSFKIILDTFIVRCNRQGIKVGMITDHTVSAIMGMVQYNIDVYHNKRNGKLNFQVLEHEYWNAYGSNSPLDSTLGKTPRPLLNSGKPAVDAFYQELHSDHKTLLFKMDSSKKKNANFWQTYDYIFYLYLNENSSFTSYHSTNLTAQQSKATDLYDKSDAIFLGHYQHYNVGGGKAFLDTASTDSKVVTWRNRLNYFGVSSSNKTKIIPFFSAEDNTHCGDGAGTPFLGHKLENLPYNGPETFYSVEESYNSQHKGIYNHTSYPNSKNTKLGAYGWFKYSCVESKTFSNTSLHLCDSLGFAYDPLKINTFKNASNKVSLFPNPSESSISIVSVTNDIKSVKVISVQGAEILKVMPFSKNELIDISTISSGIYFVEIKLDNNELETLKLIKP